MNWDLLTVAVLAGAANWAFRALPVIARADRMAAGGRLERFLGATGPAAIATLFVAAILPSLAPDWARLVPVAAGITSVVVAFGLSRSVVTATLTGAVCHGLAFWLIA